MLKQLTLIYRCSVIFPFWNYSEMILLSNGICDLIVKYFCQINKMKLTQIWSIDPVSKT